MDWKTKLSSRKFWVAVAGLVVGVIALLGIKTDTSQITGVIMALGSVVAYIVGEGLVDAAAADSQGPSVDSDGNIKVTSLYVKPTAGAGAVPQYSAPVVATVDPAAPEGTPTGAAQGAEVKQDTALGSEASASPTNGAM